MDQNQKAPDECTHECHAADSMSFCEGDCCKACPVCDRRIKADRFEEHIRRKCQPAPADAVEGRNARAMNAFEMIPGTGIETVLERALEKIHGKDGK